MTPSPGFRLLSHTALLSATLGAVDALAVERHERLINMLKGSYDNNEQVWQEREDSLEPGPRRHYRIEAGADDNELLLASAASQRAGPARWRLRFETLGDPKDGKGVVIWSTVTDTADASDAARCRFRWLPSGIGYQGQIDKPRRCDRSLPHMLIVDGDFLVVGHRDGRIDQARRVIEYRGWISMKRQHLDPAAADNDYVFMNDVEFHNEGFVQPLLDRDGTKTGYSIELARLTQQTTRTEVLKIGVIEDASGKTLRYAWTDPFADRIGINLRWITSGLTRVQR